MTESPVDRASRLVRDAVVRFKSLSVKSKAMVLAIPVLAFAAFGSGGDDNAVTGLSMAAGATRSAAGVEDSFFRTPNGIIGVDLDRSEPIMDTMDFSVVSAI